MREHIREAPLNKSQGYLTGIANKTHRYVAIIEGFNHSSRGAIAKGVMGPGTIKETVLDEELRGEARTATKNNYLPAEKYPYLLLRFYDTYTYYIYT
jgi:hypothetical protein